MIDQIIRNAQSDFQKLEGVIESLREELDSMSGQRDALLFRLEKSEDDLYLSKEHNKKLQKLCNELDNELHEMKRRYLK